MRFLVLAALLAPASAFACAMPHREDRDLAKLMADIDQAAVPAPVAETAPAPAAPVAPAETPAPAPPAPPAVIPEVAAAAPRS